MFTSYIWSLHPNSHTGIVHCVSGCVSVYNVCFQCFCKLYQSACSISYILFFNLHLSPVAISLDTTQEFCTGSISLDSVNLFRELRDNSLFVPGFQTSELNLFVH